MSGPIVLRPSETQGLTIIGITTEDPVQTKIFNLNGLPRQCHVNDACQYIRKLCRQRFDLKTYCAVKRIQSDSKLT